MQVRYFTIDNFVAGDEIKVDNIRAKGANIINVATLTISLLYEETNSKSRKDLKTDSRNFLR